jgi:hypothetical protein
VNGCRIARNRLRLTALGPSYHNRPNGSTSENQIDAAAYKLSRNFVHFFPYLSLVDDRMRKHLFLIERLCRYCNRAFTPASHNQKYCSYACRANAKLEKGKPLDQEIERCSYCDSAFMPASHNQKYCSRACRAKARLLEQKAAIQ